VKVPYREGLAIHPDPESCAGVRKEMGVAVTANSRIPGVRPSFLANSRGQTFVLRILSQGNSWAHTMIPQEAV